jgi:hypothetical protein
MHVFFEIIACDIWHAGAERGARCCGQGKRAVGREGHDRAQGTVGYRTWSSAVPESSGEGKVGGWRANGHGMRTCRQGTTRRTGHGRAEHRRIDKKRDSPGLSPRGPAPIACSVNWPSPHLRSVVACAYHPSLSSSAKASRATVCNSRAEFWSNTYDEDAPSAPQGTLLRPARKVSPASSQVRDSDQTPSNHGCF